MANMEMSDLIATMALNGATKEELNRAIEYSSLAIKLDKMREAKGIDELERKYCDGEKCDMSVSPLDREPDSDNELESLECFMGKYQSLIETAPRNSLLGMIRELDNAWSLCMPELCHSGEDDGDREEACNIITHVQLILAQMWADENQDIELSCADPATGEEVVVKNEHKCVLAPDGVCPDGCHNGDGYLCEFDDCPFLLACPYRIRMTI